ncbi:AAA family ATPase [Deinococcus sp. VB343]|uniref:AAA family ATPase n=1 Tax=Deinococcus sp. VB142 TaxID=3112952 RepID=A0AAU6Q8B8_9DEIO
MINTQAVFGHKCPHFPGIGTGGRVQMPSSCISKLDPNARQMRIVPWGAAEAVAQILLGHVQAHLSAKTVILECLDKQQAKMRIQVEQKGGGYTWVNPGTTVRPYLLLVAEALFLSANPELKERWEALIKVACPDAAPLSARRLDQLSHETAFKEALYPVLDTLYTSGKVFGGSRSEIEADLPDPGSYPHTPIFRGGKKQASQTHDTSEEGRLIRRASQGVRALLCGPTGTGKTELGKRVALKLGAKLVSIKGRPGLEDRDMIGFISPTPQGPQWVDGPLARAWRLAQQGERTVLLVDELLRLDPYHRNVLIGGLDDVSAQELHLMLGVNVPEGRYYTLELPGNGEVLYASTALLSVICTTNVGSSYTQSGEIDPALLRRFQRVMFVSYPAEQDIMPVYERVMGASAARAAYALEVKTRTMTTQHGQLLERPMNIGVTLNYLAEAKDLVALGLSEAEALEEALGVTVVPFCCSLEEGEPDIAAVKALEITLQDVLKACKVAKVA